jgi:hypothetical protein
MALRTGAFPGGAAAAWLFILLAFPAAFAGPLPAESTPAPLKTWVPWVLHGAQDKVCPYAYNDGELRQCSWPSRLSLAVGTKGGSFTQQVLAFRTLWMPLPGDARHWPQNVTIDGRPAAVVPRDQAPGVMVPPGTHALAGGFAWSELPEHLSLFGAIGLLEVSVNGARLALPNVDASGRLWLRQQPGDAKAAAIELRVHRLVSDDIPMIVTTQLDLSASGRPQEVLLSQVLLPGFVPLSLRSDLPARVEPDGRLRIQLRQGRWQVTLAARSSAAQKSLAMPAGKDALHPAEEVWAFDARNDLRIVTLEGAPAVDPQQTTLPAEWKRFPAYRMQPGTVLALNETRRGDPEPSPDKLALHRSLWLDFDGGGFTIKDDIQGSITRAWRLEMAQPQALGRVAVDGVDQHITRLAADAAPGVELRRGQADISADSRIEGAARTLSATGWTQDFDKLSARLALPPGWTLLHASGVDRAPQSWVERWTLLDFFLVLIVALACGKLFGWPWAIVSLAALTLSYHEDGAPQWAWLSLLAAIAMLRVLPPGRMQQLFAGWKWLSTGALVVLLVPFAIGEIRQALYPVLEQPWRSIAQAGDTAPEPARRFESAPSAPASSVVSRDAAKRQDLYSKIDPEAKIQTGPGLPAWQWNDYDLAWSGPVQHGQQLGLWLVSREMNAVLTAARLALVFALFACLLGLRLPRILARRGAAAALLAGCLALSGLHSPPAQAEELPTPALLEELRDKLLAPADCLPACASIARMKVSLAADALQVRLEAHADIDTSLPLPGGASEWQPERVLLDGKPAGGLARDKAGTLWLHLPRGVHQVAMESAVAGRDSIALALRLKPRRVEAEVNGWTVEGLGANGEAGESLQLTRLNAKGGAPDAGGAGQLPPFVRVERTLELGLVWRVSTRVVRTGPSTTPLLVEVPLLAGESVTTPGLPVQRGAAVVNLGAQSRAVSFDSDLAQAPQLLLRAPAQASQIHAWRLNLGPQWHAALSGIPVVHHQSGARERLPEWRPWPGEAVQLALSRPEGIEGQTLTLDRSALHLDPGSRATDVRLALRIRSSRGGQHAIALPEGAVLQAVAIDGTTQPLRLEGSTLKLPIVPGKQELLVSWREPRGVSARFSTSAVDVGLPGVNGSVQMSVPQDRWILLLGGPRVGPAILFWGVVIALVFIAFALARSGLTPLRWHHWVLLGLGLTQAPLEMSLIVVGWLLALGLRRRFSDRYTGNRLFNFGQVVLALWTLAALVSLFWAVQQGLLGTPEMQIAGNGSSAGSLNWYQDRTAPQLPRAWVLSVPLLVYKLLMLAWALWLAYALLKWLHWGWLAFSDGGYWRRLQLRGSG